RRLIDTWQTTWNAMPEGAGRTSDRVFVAGNGNRMHIGNISQALARLQCRQAAAGASVPAGWQDARDALMAHLAHEYRYSHSALAALKFRELNQRDWDPQTQELINTWQTTWNAMPKGAGRTSDRVFVAGKGNAMDATRIGLALARLQNRQAAAGAAAPAGWQHARDALMAHLAHEYHYSYGA
ncbi:hypothetical protein RY831_33100, partial [Noviherbaspirillum sp. CPCC 100848]